MVAWGSGGFQGRRQTKKQGDEEQRQGLVDGDERGNGSSSN
jgi:hypothetical protein